MVRRKGDAVLDIAAPDSRAAVLQPHLAGIDQLARLRQARIHLQEGLGPKRQLAVEVVAPGKVVAHSPLGREEHERGPRPLDRETGRGRQSVDVDRVAPAQVRADDAGIGRCVARGEVEQQPALSGEAPIDLGTEHDREARRVEGELPGGGARRGVRRRVDSVDPESRREAQQRLERSKSLRTCQTCRTGRGPGAQP